MHLMSIWVFLGIIYSKWFEYLGLSIKEQRVGLNFEEIYSKIGLFTDLNLFYIEVIEFFIPYIFLWFFLFRNW